MRKLIIDPTVNSPNVIFDPDTNVFEIKGESRPPDIREFYGQIISWLEEFSKDKVRSEDRSGIIPFNFDFEYFNSSSGKMILDICKILAHLRSEGINVEVNWHYEEDDIDMLEAGREMSKIVRLPFEFRQKMN
jgi:hypothetical protein